MDRKGQRFFNSNGLAYEIIEYKNAKEVTVKFDKSGYEKTTKYYHVRAGNVRDRLAATVYGIGYTDNIPVREGGKLVKSYQTWFSMFNRCYSDDFKKQRPSYTGVTVSEDWYHYKDFLPWFHTHYREGYELDKDLLSNLKGLPKTYSPETCVFVPQEINKCITDSKSARGDCPVGVHACSDCDGYIAQMNTLCGAIYLGYYRDPITAHKVYKANKEAYIKKLAVDYLKSDKICPRTFLGLLYWEVESHDNQV